ncbi:hypothetical protein [Streptomyces sp. UNOC14_S4]|uniref:hypothetical protein n=1 Tax=Streptomyces sp. UNOC14_S4 TaxID=2872340 RepID=UPI001E4269CA|nr:hypothetical protein [Streptomyces sp. UNOC14_S4]MCC3772072.1 hypothetical protein [Streptomyces sp. UNOC14_S4]
MTVGEIKEWLKTLSPPTPEVALPDGLPDELGELKNAVNLDALSDWFAMSSTLTMMVPDTANLCVTGIIVRETPNLSLWFFSDDEANPDDAPVIGVQVGLALRKHPVLSVLGALGLREATLVHEIRVVDGAAVRELYAQAALVVDEGVEEDEENNGEETLLIICPLDFATGQKSYAFAVEPEAGKERRTAEALFGLFGATPPPALEDVTPRRLTLTYEPGEPGEESARFRIAFPTKEKGGGELVATSERQADGTLTWTVRVDGGL